nr:hypothetical protein [Nitrosopumilus sp.]
SSSSSRNNDDEPTSSSSRNNDDDDSNIDRSIFSNRMDDSDFGFNFDDSSDDRSGSSGSGVDGILNNVEDTMRSVGIDFSFN